MTPTAKHSLALLAACALVCWMSDVSSARPAAATPRIVAIADVHGDGDAFRRILKAVRLIDDAGRWAGGNATLVQTGDLLDRGANVRAVMDLLMGLEAQAKTAGGRVEALFGNHEGMNLIGELRDTNPAAFASFVDDRSDRRRADAYDEYAKLAASRSKALGGAAAPYQKDREAWMAAHPAGFLEYREALGRDGRYGRWLRSRNAVAQIGDTIFLHGGISPDVASRSIKDINDRVRNDVRAFDEGLREMVSSQLVLPSFTLQEVLEAVVLEVNSLKVPENLTEEQARHVAALRDLVQINKSWLLDADGPLWFRGYANWTAKEGPRLIGPILRKYNARYLVVGHTPMATTRITPRFDNRVFLIDTGMLSSYYKGGRASALEIQNGRFTAIYADERVPLEW
ncbi:MAG: metallophosphoesterase [Acidobacteria bacterium]|nr:metallophosphoesterase [Acidobacteriota bacterium]